MHKDITKGIFKFGDLHEKKGVSLPCLDLIMRLMLLEPEKRISAKEALNHQWVEPVAIFSNKFVLWTSKEIETLWILNLRKLNNAKKLFSVG